MTVFKGYLKILKKQKWTVTLYLAIFTLLALIFNQDIKQNMVFENKTVPVLWIDHDQTELTNDLKDYLQSYAVYKTIREEQIEDAFFYRDIELIVEIPKGFTASLKTKEPLKLKTKSVPNSSRSFTFETELEKYLNLAHLYLSEDIPAEHLTETIRQHLNVKTDVQFTQKNHNNFNGMMFYFNFLAYVLLALIITVIGVIMYSFKSIDIKRRLHLASMSMKKINFILILGNLFLGFILFAFLMGLSLVVQWELMFTRQGMLFTINAFLFMLNTITLAYLIASIFDSVNVITALGTICSLGFAFVTGIFVPQEFLNANLLRITRIIPSYWYVRNNRLIASMTLWNLQTAKQLMMNYGVIVLMGLIFIVIAFFISRWKRQAEH